jgi:hypothetical protein
MYQPNLGEPELRDRPKLAVMLSLEPSAVTDNGEADSNRDLQPASKRRCGDGLSNSTGGVDLTTRSSRAIGAQPDNAHKTIVGIGECKQP